MSAAFPRVCSLMQPANAALWHVAPLLRAVDAAGAHCGVQVAIGTIKLLCSQQLALAAVVDFALCIGCSSMRILGLPHHKWVSRLHPLDG